MAASCRTSIASILCSSGSRAPKPPTWTRSSGCSCRRPGARSRMPAMSEPASRGGVAESMLVAAAATISRWLAEARRIFRHRPSGAMPARSSRPASPITSTCGDLRLPSIPHARARWWPCIWLARDCGLAKPNWRWRGVYSCSVRQVSLCPPIMPACCHRRDSVTPSMRGRMVSCRARGLASWCSSLCRRR